MAGQPRILSKLLCEYVGTFFLCLVIAYSPKVSNVYGAPYCSKTPISSASPIIVPAQHCPADALGCKCKPGETLDAPITGSFAGLAIGVILMAMIYAGGHISGANYNPAVSVALACTKNLSWFDCICYICAQCFAALSAAAIGRSYLGPSGFGCPTIVHGGAAVPEDKGTSWQAFAFEYFYCNLLCLTVLCTAVYPKNQRDTVVVSSKIDGPDKTGEVLAGKESSLANHYLVKWDQADGSNSQAQNVYKLDLDYKRGNNSFFGMAIGFAVVSGAYTVGSISGGAFNPAVGLMGIFHTSVDATDIAVYWGAGITAGISSAVLYTLVTKETVPGSKEHWAQIYFMEFIGTFYLCMSCSLAKNQFAPLCIGSTLMVVVYMGGTISGAHFNPAVTLAVALNEMLFMPPAPSVWQRLQDGRQKRYVTRFLETKVSPLRERLIVEDDKSSVRAEWETMLEDFNNEFASEFSGSGTFTEEQIIDIHDYLAPHDWLQKFAFWIFQIFGAICAGWTAQHCTADFQSNLQANFPKPNDHDSRVYQVFCEIMGTTALCWVVLCVAVAKDAEAKHYYGLAIGMTVMFVASAVGSISGGAFNPAVGTGLQVVDTSGDKCYLWIYWVGPLTGAVIGALLFRLTHKSSKEHPKYD